MTQQASKDTTDTKGSEGDPNAPGEGSQESPDTVESLKERLELEEGRRKAAEAAQGSADRTAAQSKQQLSSVIRTMTRNQSAEKQKADRKLAEEDPLAYSEQRIQEIDATTDADATETIRAEAKREAMEEAGAILLEGGRQNPIFQVLSDSERTEIQQRVLAEGQGAAEVMAAWAGAVANKRSGDVESMTERLDALEKGETSDILDGDDNGPATPGGGGAGGGGDLGRKDKESPFAHINRLKKTGAIDTAEWNRRKEALTNV